MRPAPPPAPPPPSRRELLATWALAIAGIGAARGLAALDPTGLLGANLAGVAAVLFVWLPDRRLRARGEGWEAHGAPFLAGGPAGRRDLWRGLLVGLGVLALLAPAVVGGFALFTRWHASLPPALAGWLGPYRGATGLSLRWPPRLPLLAATQLLVVAVPEELFYRGWLQTGWARAEPGRGVTVLGARLGGGFLRTQLLFAAGHLVSLQPWRLATFLPGLLFGWLRERTGSVVAPAVVHAGSNLLLLVLEQGLGS